MGRNIFTVDFLINPSVSLSVFTEEKKKQKTRHSPTCRDDEPPACWSARLFSQHPASGHLHRGEVYSPGRQFHPLPVHTLQTEEKHFFYWIIRHLTL